MSSRRRGRQRATQQASKIGEAVHLHRITDGVTLSDAARRAGIARSTWQRIEEGSPAVTLANFVAATDAIGLDLVCQLYPGRPTSLRDSGQLTIAQALSAAAASTLAVTFERRAGDHGEAIDLVLASAAEIIAIEIETVAADWQAQYRRAALKRDWLAAHSDRPVRLVIVFADTRRNRAALGPFSTVMHQALPAGTGAVLRSIRTGSPLGSDGLCWFRSRPARHPSSPA